MLLKSRRLKIFDVQYFPSEEVVILRKVKAKLYTQFNSIGLLFEAHNPVPGSEVFDEMWKKVRRDNHIAIKLCDPIKFIKMDENVKFFLTAMENR